ncbi:MAG: NAD-dependent epimerase/dehydratase family protein [Nannocystaceae bacterium]
MSPADPSLPVAQPLPPTVDALVIGGSSFSGCQLVEDLCADGQRVRVFDLHRRPGLPPEVEVIEGDMTDLRAVTEACRGVATVYHYAALLPFGRTHRVPDAELLRVNVGGTHNIIEACLACGVARLIYISSTGAVFSGKPVVAGDESLPYPEVSNDPYSHTKKLAEQAVLAANGPVLKTVALRPNGIWGAGETHHFPKVLAMAQMGMAGIMFGLQARTDWTHRKNLAHASILACKGLSEQAAVVGGQAYFITDDDRHHVQEFMLRMVAPLGFGRLRVHLPGVGMVISAAIFEALTWVSKPVLNRQPFLSFADVRKVVQDNHFSVAKAREQLGYEPVVSTEQGVAECIADFRQQGYDGHVEVPGAAWWVAICFGMVLLAAVVAFPGFWLGEWIYALLPWLKPMHMQCLLAAAGVSHLTQALVVAGRAHRMRMSTAAWFGQTLVLGFPSSQRFHRRIGAPSSVAGWWSMGSFLLPLAAALWLASP